jgi:rod shape-determining protein MreC
MPQIPRRWKGACYFFILALGFAYLAYSAHRSPAPTRYQRAVLRIVSPAIQGIRSASGGVASLFGDYAKLRGVSRENSRLKTDLERSAAAQSALREELHRLSLLLRLQESQLGSGSSGLIARVIGYDPAPARRSLWIDRGSRDGIELDQAVVDDRGLVGRIFKLATNSAQVLLLTDPHSVVDVVDQQSRARGTLTGLKKQMSLNRERWLTQAEYISAQEEIRPGDLLLSSGLDGVFPAGLPVGTVSEVQKDASGLFLNAQVLPQVEFMKLEAVRVLSRDPELGKQQSALADPP